MKFRLDFVSNSSSTSYMVLAIDDDIQNKILDKEGIDPENTHPWDMNFQAPSLRAISDGWGNIRWICQELCETDLRRKTLSQLEIDLVDELNETYNLGVSYSDIYFDMDTIHD